MIPTTFEYELFCEKLLAPPLYSIRSYRDTYRFNMSHCLIGLAGELIELLIGTSSENRKYELSDILFYRTSVLNLSLAEHERQLIHRNVILSEEDLNDEPFKSPEELADQFLDMGKRIGYYGHDVTSGELITSVALLDQFLLQEMKKANMDQFSLMALNMEKLKKRYGDKGFSVQSSIDKVDGT